MAIAVISNRVGAVTITFTLGAVTVIYTAAVPAAGVY